MRALRGSLLTLVAMLSVGCSLREAFEPSDDERVAQLADAARAERAALENTLARDATVVIDALDAEVESMGDQVSVHGELGPVVDGNRLVTVVAGRAALHLEFIAVRNIVRTDDPERPFAGTIEIASTRTQVQVQTALVVAGIVPSATLAHLEPTLEWPPDLPEPILPSSPDQWPAPAALVAAEAVTHLDQASHTTSSGSHLIEFIYDRPSRHWLLAQGRTPDAPPTAPAAQTPSRGW